MDFFQTLATPSRAKAFDPARAVSHELIDKLTRSAERAPRAGHQAGWHAEIVRTADAKERLSACGLASPQCLQAPMLLVFCADRTRAATTPTVSAEHGAQLDAAAAAAIAWASAIALGLAVDWVAQFDARKLAKALDLQPCFLPVVLLAVGYEK